MNKKTLKNIIDVAAGRSFADLVIKNCKIVDVYNATVIENKSIAVQDGFIAGVGDYEGKMVIDAAGQYVAPGFIDGHIHIESSCITPEEFGRLVVPLGTTTIIADPHEIVNVAGLDGMEYMLEAAQKTSLDIKYMLPSCVPATLFEHSGANIDADAMRIPITEENILGLGEFMNYPGVINADDSVLDKIMVADEVGKLIDGHSPGIEGNDLTAYIAAGIHTDHECSSVKEMQDRISRGMYVMLREGSACHDLETLLEGLTAENSRRCLFCSDDRQTKTIFELGHLDYHLRMCVNHGVNPITAVQMASLNAAECFRLYDRGGIAPGLRADLVILKDLKEFEATHVFIKGELIAKDHQYLPAEERCEIKKVLGKFHIKDFSIDKLSLKVKSNHVNVIDILPGGVVTAKTVADVTLNDKHEFLYDPRQDIVKVAVVERYQNTGNVALGLLRGYGIKTGAIALSIAHDSHNIITVGTNDEDMSFAVKELIHQGGGIILVKDQKIINSMPMLVGGIMSDQSGEWVNQKLSEIHLDAYEKLGVSKEVEPVMTLCFMSLPVIPEIKLTDMGLFDVKKFAFIPIEADDPH